MLVALILTFHLGIKFWSLWHWCKRNIYKNTLYLRITVWPLITSTAYAIFSLHIPDNKDDTIWLVGSFPTIIDITMAILLDRLHLVGLSGQLFEYGHMPHVEKYFQSLMKWEEFKTINSRMPSIGWMLVKDLMLKAAKLGSIVGAVGVAYFVYKKFKSWKFTILQLILWDRAFNFFPCQVSYWCISNNHPYIAIHKSMIFIWPQAWLKAVLQISQIFLPSISFCYENWYFSKLFIHIR